MANLKEIRGRITSVKNTRKITSAMSRIASARLRKSQTTMESARGYGQAMASITSEVIAELDDPSSAHPLLTESNKHGRTVIILVVADRGLCGPFNAGITRATMDFAAQKIADGREVSILAVGNKSGPLLRQKELDILKLHPAPTLDNAVELSKTIAEEAMAMFLRPKDAEEAGLQPADEVFLAFNYFQNVLTQETRIEGLVPLSPAKLSEGTGEQRKAVRRFEPGFEELLAHLLPTAVETAIQQAFFNSIVSEVAARRAAMDAATDNAGELINELTLEFNRERQAAITKELMEIIGGAEALK